MDYFTDDNNFKDSLEIYIIISVSSSKVDILYY